MRVSIIDTEQEFRDLSEAWNNLARSAGGSVFFRHEWFDSAWRWRKEDSSLFILLALEGNSLVGILPLVRGREKRRLLSISTLEFLTVPDTQLCDLIVAPHDRVRVGKAFSAALDSRRNEWDRMMLRYLGANAVALDEFKESLAIRGYAWDIKTQGLNLFVGLESSWEAYYGTRSRSLKKAINLAANRLKKAGEISIEWITPENSDELAIQKALEHCIDISRRSWKQATGNSLDHAGPRSFITTLTTHAARSGSLSVWLISIAGKPLAMEYQLLDMGNVYALRADFDADCGEISPGSHLMRMLLESLFGKNLRRYYMGPGENAYKTRWTQEGEMLHHMIVHGRTWRGQLIRFVDNVLKPLARSGRSALASAKNRVVTKGYSKSVQ